MKNINVFNLLIGVLMIVAGIGVCFNPIVTLKAISLYIGIVFVCIGTAYMVNFFKFSKTKFLTYGILDVLVGIILITNKNIVVSSLPIVLGFWVLFSAISQLSTAVEFKKMKIPLWSYEMTLGICGLIFSFIILVNPIFGALTIALITGFYMILFGVAEIYEFYIMRELND